MNIYHQLAAEYVRLALEGKQYPLGTFPPCPRPTLKEDAPKALIFSPHPDDEVIIGALPLRLLRESGMRIINVAVTQGSNQARRTARWDELKRCCDCIGFELIATAPGGLEQINPEARAANAARWSESVAIISRILAEQKPHCIFFPHAEDWNNTHEGTHLLIMDALQILPESFECFLVETEFWGQMDEPNLMVESASDEVGDLLTALTFHEGEVRRNPYHLIVPAWMRDNVRRGCELVGGQGGPAPDFVFATLYRLRRWSSRQVHELFAGGKYLPSTQSAARLFA